MKHYVLPKQNINNEITSQRISLIDSNNITEMYHFDCQKHVNDNGKETNFYALHSLYTASNYLMPQLPNTYLIKITKILNNAYKFIQRNKLYELTDCELKLFIRYIESIGYTLITVEKYNELIPSYANKITE